ncbi:MAG: MarR family transcriptional regulator [Deferribacteraceae bacterium]|nr:MarR family transcriptional regulator [Deferribacteraceae bacterium]
MKIIHVYNLANRTMAQSNGRFPRTQGTILKILSKHGNMPQKDLAACLQVSGPSVSQLITKMEKNGLVKRNEGEIDGRFSLVTATKKGKNVVVNLRKTSENSLNELFNALTDAEKGQFSELLSKIIFSLGEGKEMKIHNFCEKCGLCTQSYEI